MKWLSSFRARLILTVFPVVAGITIATLVLAEWKFVGTYKRLFAEQFEAQIGTFTATKKKRTEALSVVLGGAEWWRTKRRDGGRWVHWRW